MGLDIVMRSRVSVVAVAILLSVGLVACGSSASSSTTVPTTSSSGSASTATEATTSVGATSPASTPTSAATPMTSTASSAASPGAAGTTVMVGTDPKLGKILTDANGMTLYFYAKDTAGSSACTGGCAANWPPLTVSGTPTAPSGVTGTLATITRDDGSMQVTYNGKPLYTFIRDKAPGDTTGQGVGGVWTVATP